CAPGVGLDRFTLAPIAVLVPANVGCRARPQVREGLDLRLTCHDWTRAAQARMLRPRRRAPSRAARRVTWRCTGRAQRPLETVASASPDLSTSLPEKSRQKGAARSPRCGII